jgi:regulatory protein
MMRGRRTRTSAARASAPASRGGGASPPDPKVIAIRLLARREYGRAELAARLHARGVAADVAERTLDELAAQGYLSDARFAEALVAGRSGRFSRRAIAYELAGKRVAPETAADALAPLAARDEQADAHALWERRFGVAPRDERDKARHVRFLLSRGYSLSVALKVLKAAGTQVPDDEPAS